MLTPEIAKERWRYDPSSGTFFWLFSPRYGVCAGDRAGFFNGKYWMLRHGRRAYKAARVAWLMTHGEWPKNQIDHIDGDKLNDRIDNLRDATNSENCRNRKMRPNNKAGVKGVGTARYGYQVQVCKDGKNYYIGHFRTIDAAKAAYDYASKRLHGEFARS